MVTALHDAEREKCHRNCFQRLDDPLEYSSKINIWRTQKNSKNNPDVVPQIYEFSEPSNFLST